MIYIHDMHIHKMVIHFGIVVVIIITILIKLVMKSVVTVRANFPETKSIIIVGFVDHSYYWC